MENRDIRVFVVFHSFFVLPMMLCWADGEEDGHVFDANDSTELPLADVAADIHTDEVCQGHLQI